MNKKVISVLLVIVGFINFFPVIGIVSSDVLAGLYGIDAPAGDLLILLRHRALLFGLLGALIIVSAFRERLQSIAICSGFVAMIGFILISLTEPEKGEAITSVANIDIVATLLLAIVVFLRVGRTTERKTRN
ncbi:MAG: phosphopantetheine adenylyltransferase [Pyrinomonadaceae bacterium]|nr:phosphopantetheine adenylyltransferase [Pyrinomonadaceae bacterium]